MTGAARGPVCVIVNPAKMRRPARLRAVIDGELAARGLPPARYLSTTVEDPGASQARAARDAGAGRILVVGGDGTVRMVLGALRGSGIPVGLVPAGTGNVLARNLRLPLRTGPAIRGALDGTPRPLDLIRFQAGDYEGHFAMMGGVGADAAVVADTTDPLKRFGLFGYVLAGRRHVRIRPVRTRITVDGEEIVRDASLVMVGNLGELREGVPLLPLADGSDGVLDALIASPRNLRDVLRMILGVLLRRPRIPYVERLTGRTVVVECDEPVPCQVDGDSLGDVRLMRFEVLPGAVLIAAAVP